MSVRTRDQDDIVVEIDAGGDRPRGCLWDESVCTRTPTHRVVPPAHNLHHDEPTILCARHYALTMARLVIVHLPGCDAPLAEHVVAHGDA